MHDGSGTEFHDLLTSAERVLAARWATRVRLGDVEQLSEERRRNLLLRCQVLDGPADAPTSLIVKRASRHNYDPDDPKSRPAVCLFRDWAGLQFLATVDDGRLACPKFYGGDRQAGFFLMEDLGGTIELDEVLTRGCAEDARRALLALAETLGRMHALCAGHCDEFQRIRDALGPGDGGQRLRLAEHVRDYAPALIERCEALDVKVSPAITADIEHVAQVMADPGPLLTYTHADACPDNCVLAGDRLRLFDYEFGNFRHALLDGVYGWIRFPTCWCVRDIPVSVVNEMESVYRRELVLGLPAAADDQVYFPAVADACAYWVLENLAHLLDRALRYEEPKGTSTNRQRILTRLTAFCEVTQRANHLAGLRQTFERLLEVLRRRWADNMPLYDAFAQPTALREEEVLTMVEAIVAGDQHRVGQLLDHAPGLANAKATDADQTPMLYLAMDPGNSESVKLLLDHGADWRITTRSGWTVLSRACSHGTPQIVDLLLQHGTDLNSRDIWGSLPIYTAVTTRNAAMLKHLIARGAQPDLKVAIDLNRLDMARQLLEQDSSSACMRFGTGLTLLHDSAQVGDTRLDAMRLLLEFGGRVNSSTNWGATPLHLAAFHGNLRTIALLLANGADASVKDKRGLTPRMLSEGKGHKRCAALLGGHGAEGVRSNTAGTASDEMSPADRFFSYLGGTQDEEPHPLNDLDRAFGIWRDEEDE